MKLNFFPELFIKQEYINQELVKQDIDEPPQFSIIMVESEHVFRCDLCPKTYQMMASLKRHKQETHENIRKMKCSRCEYETTRKYRLTRHMYTHQK